MNPEQFRELVNRVAQNLSNQALVTELLTQVTEAFDTTHTSLTGVQTSNTELTSQIGELQKTNMNLFLRVTNPNPAPINPQAVQGDKPLTYEDLINDLGGNK